MLMRRLAAAALILMLGVLAAPAVAGAADGGGSCDTNHDPSCITFGGGDGSPGDGGSTGASGCTWLGQSVPCRDSDFGSYVGGGCYWKALVPPPDQAPPLGKDPAKGAWGVESCYLKPGSTAVTQVFAWQDDPAAGPTPAELARQALAKIHLLGAEIGVAPSPIGSGAVGLPVWLWTAVTPGTWGPLTASASGGGITVTITAHAQRILWDMGDGHQVTCANPGTPYKPQFGNSASPTCPYAYSAPSSTPANPGGRYAITATTDWTANWAGGGQTGVLTPTSQSQTSVQIGEIQVVTQ